VIERDRLLSQFVDGPAADLILVHGPAGFGKTTLLRSAYLALQEKGTAWLTLDEADDDTEHLLVHLLAALGEPGVADDINDDKSVGITHINSVSNTLTAMQEHLSKLPEGFTLFLDEFDAIQTPTGLKTVFRTLQSLAPGSRMVIGCRTLPPWPLGSMRAQGRLLEIDANQLRFSLNETRQVINSGKLHVKYDDALIEHLHKTTEGWIGSIQLAALSLATTNDAEGFIRDFTGSNADLADYLAEDLLARQPDAVRKFLLKTSILDNLCAPLCDAILKSNNSTQMLRELERSNLFLFALDDKREWYRYHNLFRDFLRGQTSNWDKGELSELHHAAAEWCARNERPSTSINHALASGDMEYAANLINLSAMKFYCAGRLATLQRWIDQLPEDILLKYPETQVVYVWCLVTFFQDEKRIEENLARLESIKPLPSAIRDEILILGPYNLLRQDRLEESSELCKANLCIDPEPNLLARGVLENINAFCLMKLGQLSESETAARNAQRAHVIVGAVYGKVVAECFAGMVELARGRLQSALALLTAARAETGQMPQSSAPTVITTAYMITVLFETNQEEELSTLLDDFGSIIDQLGMPEEVINLHLILARLAYRRNNYSEACRILNDLRHVGQARNIPRMIAIAWNEQARMAALRGDTDTADHYLAQAERSKELLRYDRAQWFLSRATLRMQKGIDLRIQLQAELKDAETGGLYTYALRIRLLLVKAFIQYGNLRKARSELGIALKIAGREGFVSVILDSGEAVLQQVKVCRANMDSDLSRDFLRSIFPETLLMPEDAHLPLDNLTARELETLNLVALGCSNQSIGDRLCISLPTVKTHLRNVNSKLDAKNRNEAVAKARRLNLLD